MSSMLLNRLDVISSRLSIHLPFIAAVGMSMLVQIEKVKSACTNGVWVKFDPDFCATLTDPELSFVYGHETMHKALLHGWRRGMRIPGIWNAACDHVINLALKAMRSTAIKMPAKGLCDARFTGMSEEQVYDILLAEGYEPPPDYTLDIIEEGQRSQADAEIEVVNIAKACEMAGVKSAMIDLVLGAAARSPVRWQDVLRTFVTHVVRSGSTWSRPNRRSHALGIYLPSLRSKVLRSIVVFGDFSGSMMQLVGEVMSEVQSIVDEVHPEQTHVVCGDTRVTFAETFERDQPIIVRPRGGGGTDFRPLFAEVVKRDWQPACGIFLTDTYGDFPATPPDYPVIWGVLGARAANVRVPFGEIVGIRG